MFQFSATLVLFGLGFALAIPGTFEFMKNTCHFIYGDPLGQWETMNDIQCVRSCMQHKNCSSLMYEKGTRQCFLNAEILENGSQFPPDCGVQYAVQVERYLGCNESWQYLDGRCYLYVDTLLTWFGCDTYCIGQKSYLAKVYNLSTYSVLLNATETGRLTATMPSDWTWITVNDLIQEDVCTDRDGVPINPDLLPTVLGQTSGKDCGAAHSDHVKMSECDVVKNCLCEKQLGVMNNRPRILK